MDFCERLNKVATLNDYIEVTQVLENTCKDVKFVFNRSMILCLQKIRCLEIEYFSKCDGSGAAFYILGRMLTSSASTTWGLLGPEVVGLVHYWLEAVRKHLISHHICWWSFMKHLLGFIKEMRKKDSSIGDILVSETAETILDLATSGKLDITQRYEILHTFNLVCCDSSRKVRLSLRQQLEPYFIRLSTIMATCGHLPSQLAALETKLRWLLPRQDLATKKDAAKKWFPPHLYPEAAFELFLTRSWMNFSQDARDFLNCHNSWSDLIVSVICRKLSVGKTIIISGEERREAWLDINTGSGCITVILEPHVLEALGWQDDSYCEALTVAQDNVKMVKLYRESNEVRIFVPTVQAPAIVPSAAKLFDDQDCNVNIVISSNCLKRVDVALRSMFEDRYQVTMDVENTAFISPARATGLPRRSSMDENPRFSKCAKKIRRTPRFGRMLGLNRLAALKSQSSVSTSSLAQLHDKLENIPYYQYPKETLAICVEPSLSVVNESNESEISNSFNSISTLKLQNCGVRTKDIRVEERKSQSDGEVLNKQHEKNNDIRKLTFEKIGSYSDNEYLENSIHSIPIQFNDTSLLASASGDESFLIGTVERFPLGREPQTNQLCDLLLQEALQHKDEKNKLLDSGINTGEGKKTQEQDDCETIEDTQYTGFNNTRSVTSGLKQKQPKTQKNSKVVSKSTSDESNTEAIINSPVSYVNVRKRNQRRKSVKQNEIENTTEKPNENDFDVQVVEDFFSQHFAENERGEILVSPTLAKKINETSSETSDDYHLMVIDDNFDIHNADIPDLDVVECLNDIVDKVCSDFEKCTKYLHKEVTESKLLDMAKNISLCKDQETAATVASSDIKNMGNKKSARITRSKSKQTVKVKVPSKKLNTKKGKLKIEPVSKMSVILEENNESDANKTSCSDAKRGLTDTEKKTPLAKRKRKLYSPKDDQIEFEKDNPPELLADAIKCTAREQSDDEDIALAELKNQTVVTPKSVASCYKEIEKERRKYRTRARKSKNIVSPPSPKTKKLDDAFEKLKDNIECHGDNITFVDKKSDKELAIFNFTSDSEDEDFKQKKNEIQKRTSTTTIGSGTSVISTRRGRKKAANADNGKESSNDTIVKSVKCKRYTKRNKSKAKTHELKAEISRVLIDERMREALPEVLNTSFHVEKGNDNVKDTGPIIQVPELENISDDNANIDIKGSKNNNTESPKLNIDESTKKISKHQEDKQNKNKLKKSREKAIKDDEITLSPLPGLIIESEKGTKEVEDSLTTNLVQKLQKIYKEGPDAYNDTITTQNMLSDNEKPNNSPQMNITEELGISIQNINIDNNQKVDHKTTDFDDINDVINDTITSEHSAKTSKLSSSKSKKRSKLRLKNKDKTESALNSGSVKADKTKISVTSRTETSIDKNNTDNQFMESQKSKKSVKSNIEEINYNKIICVENATVTRSKTARSKSREIEIIEITTTGEVKSERSIATNGITAHGEENESPPSSKLLGEKMLPREIEDMDQSIREYYIELTAKVNKSQDSGESRIKSKPRNEKSTPQQNSKNYNNNFHESFVTSHKSRRRNQFEGRDYDTSQILPSCGVSESEATSQSSVKKPTISITRLSLKEIAKWIPSEKTTPESSNSADKFKETSRRSPILVIKKSSIKKPALGYEAETSKEISRRSPRMRKHRKSQISPIKLDDFIPKCNIISNNTSRSAETTAEFVPRMALHSQRYFLRRTQESSVVSNVENCDKSEQSSAKVSIKRKSPITKAVDAKRRKSDEEFRVETVDISSSRQSSNVEDWLKRIPTIAKVDNIDASYDTLQNLMEKLDTTLAEIHQNTTKDFIGLFVEAHKRLDGLKEKRRESYRATAVAILTDVTQILDTQFAEMDRRAEERDDELKRWLKERAGEVLRRDCRQKQAMVALLREDVQAAADRLARTPRE